MHLAAATAATGAVRRAAAGSAAHLSSAGSVNSLRAALSVRLSTACGAQQGRTTAAAAVGGGARSQLAAASAAGGRIASSSYSSSSSSSSGSSSGKAGASASGQEGAGPDAQGMDLFAQAMAAEKARGEQEQGSRQQQQQQQQHQNENQQQQQEGERMRRINETREREESEHMAKSLPFYTGVLAASLLGMYAYMGLPKSDEPKASIDSDESTESNDSSESQPAESAWAAHNRRAWAELVSYYLYWTDPPATKILPDPLPPPYQRPFTLCVELNDSLVHLVWDKSLGWRAAVRPGAKQFLANLSRHYEVVIFTTSQGHLAEPVISALDPFQYAMYRLYRDHTKLEKGKFVKDLSLLNRDLGKIMVVDINPENYRLQPENGLKLKPWHGAEDDVELQRLETFLEEFSIMLNLMGTNDLRPLLGVLHRIDLEDPAGAWDKHKDRLRHEFNRTQEAARAELAAKQQQLQTAQPPAIISAVGSFLGSLVGFNRSAPIAAGAQVQSQQPGTPATGSASSTATALANSPNIIDMIENYAREERKLFLKDQEENKRKMEEMQREQEEMYKKQMEENKQKKMTLIDYLSGAGQPPAPGTPGSDSPSAASPEAQEMELLVQKNQKKKQHASTSAA